MKSDVYQCLNIYKEDYLRLKERQKARRGATIAELFRELLDKTEPIPRNHDGKFTKAREDTNDASGIINS
jgi:hypothetical protein